MQVGRRGGTGKACTIHYEAGSSILHLPFMEVLLSCTNHTTGTLSINPMNDLSL